MHSGHERYLHLVFLSSPLETSATRHFVQLTLPNLTFSQAFVRFRGNTRPRSDSLQETSTYLIRFAFCILYHSVHILLCSKPLL